AEQSEHLRGLAACDIRALPFPAHHFDGAFNIFTSLGLFLSDEEDLAALREIRRVIRPGGCFLLESMHRDDVISDFAARDAWTLPDGTEVEVRRRFDAIRGISYERLRWKRGTETGEKRHALKLRTATEIDALLQQAGFVQPHYYGDWDGSPFSHQSAHLIAVTRAP
ncbi:MAG: class I SAM-dependent methyltransferase, partial [Longimicrobiales bacterium]